MEEEIIENINDETVDFEDVDLSDIVDDEEETLKEEVGTPAETKEEVKEESKEEDDKAPSEEVESKDTPEFELEINYNGTKEKISKEEAITLAQKGKDYDRIRKVYDFVKDLAEDEGKSVDDFIKQTSDNLKDYNIKQLAEEKGITEEVAKELYESRVAQKRSLASEKEQQEKNEAELKRQADFKDFLDTYPNIDVTTISKEVWDKVNNGTPLKYAYMEYEMNVLKTENTQLKTNAKNKEQEITTGTQAQAKAKDIYDEAWDMA